MILDPQKMGRLGCVTSRPARQITQPSLAFFVMSVLPTKTVTVSDTNNMMAAHIVSQNVPLRYICFRTCDRAPLIKIPRYDLILLEAE